VAVKIRLKRMGKIRAPYYRIVVADSRTKRDGRVIEEIGKYHPKEDPSFIEVNSDRAQYWLGVGAQASEPVAAILKVTGDWQKFKGQAAPAPMQVAEPRRDKAELFNEALKDSHGDPKTEAVTARRGTAKKAAPSASAATEAAPGAAEKNPAAGTTAAAETQAEPAPAAVVDDEAIPEEAPVDETSPVGEAAAEEALDDDVPTGTETAAEASGGSATEA
jgi:small subunit ribosomal protein S16